MNNWMPQTSKNLILNNRVNHVPPSPKLLLFLKAQLQMGSHSHVFSCLGSPGCLTGSAHGG